MPTKKTTTKKTAAKKATKKVAPRKAVKATKTATKKKAIKKPAVKRSASKVAAMKKPVKDLVYASDQESFWMMSGEILNSLVALRDAFEKMEKDVYQYHAQGDQNDFAVWVESVLCDAECAADLAKAKTQKGAKTVVVKHLKLYSV